MWTVEPTMSDAIRVRTDRAQSNRSQGTDPLADELATLRCGFLEDGSQEDRGDFEYMLTVIRDSGRYALRVGERMPQFELPDQIGAPVRSEDLIKSGPVVLSFYRGKWCPYCQAELRALRFALPEIRRAGAELVSISPQLPDESVSLAQRMVADYTVLSDVGNQAAEQFGIVIELPDVARSFLERHDVNLADYNGDDSSRLPIPATYVIDRDGVIVLTHVESDFTRRCSIDAIMEALRALANAESPGL